MEQEKCEDILGQMVFSTVPKPFVIVGIPAYNEEKTIEKVVLESQKHADMVVVCDDGSTDKTGDIAKKSGATVLRHMHNSGYGAALQSLFKHARDLKADILVTLDGDGQHDPSEIPQVLRPISLGQVHVVLGSRFIEQNGTSNMPLHRQFGVRMITKITNTFNKSGISDAQSGFRAYSKWAVDTLFMSEKGMNASVELLREIGKKNLIVGEVPISCRYSNNLGTKTSKENSISHGAGLFLYLMKLFLEDRPLLLVGVPGTIMLAVGAIFGVWMLYAYAIYHQIITNIALGSIAFGLTGFFMTSTSIILYEIARLGERLKEVGNGI